MTMKIDALPNLVRDSKRLHEVVSTLVRYGLAPWLEKANVGWVRKHLRAASGEQIGELSQGARLRLAMTELGTTFIKLGQILSTRPDLVGPEITSELKKLQANTPADSPQVIRGLIESELGGTPDELFLEFDDEPAASASIGQVHFATMKDGTSVVVKIQHSGIEGKIHSDMEIMRILADLAERYSSHARQLRPADTLAELARTLLAELDFTRELRNLERFEHNFAQDPRVCFPKPYSALSSARVLTMDRLVGVGVGYRDELQALGYDLSDLARRGANVFLEMIFRDGFYHADPHPGNILALENATIGLLDCGMVGRIDETFREQFEDLLMACAGNDAQAVCDTICEMGSVPPEMDPDALRSDLDDFLAEFGSQDLSNFDLGGVLNRMMAIIRRYSIILPTRLSLLIKVLVMLEGTARDLSPAFSLAGILEPYKEKILKRRLAPGRLLKKARHSAADWSRLVEMAPRDLADILTQVKRGRFEVHLEHRKLDSIANRMVMGILSAALFVGSAMIWSRAVPPLLGGVPVFGVLGCLVAFFMGASLVRAIRRSGGNIELK
jgi:ubiquinone biosynthesis protein